MSMQAHCGCTMLSSISTACTKIRNQSKLHLPEMSILSPANKPLQSCRNRVTSLQNIQNHRSKNLEVQMGGNYNNMIL